MLILIVAQTIAFPLQTVAGPKQARSERTLQRLLDAAQVLIEEKGHAAVSIPEIARRARSSVGGFYARFRDKNELLRALEERHFIEVWQRLEALADARRWENVSTAQVVEAAVAELVSVTRERRRLIAAFLVSAIQDPAIREGGLRFRRRVEECIRGLLLPRRGEMDHPDPALAVDLAVQTAFALMNHHVLIEKTEAAGRPLSDDELRRELTTMFLRYVGIARPASSRTKARKRRR
ncbi:MAG: TetR/AcrR family transcriptional regulator [Deltaproteobacteria bacterium]|nr:MAG: TetR/AcrR family transcriptional regulator [Deltaproteobacteria bacterium]